MPRKAKHGGRRKGAGRPREPGAYSARLVVRMTPELLERVEIAAEEAMRTVPEFVRNTLEAAARPTHAGATDAANKCGSQRHSANKKG